MNYLAPLGRVFGNLKGFYSGINGATLTGAIDVIVIEQEDGSFKCSPFHVRFGKLGVLRSKEKVVDIEVNGIPAPFRMKLGDSGEAFFVEEVDPEDELSDENLATSPLPGSPQGLPFNDPVTTVTVDVDSIDTSAVASGSNEVVIPIEEETHDVLEPSNLTSSTPTTTEGFTKGEDPKKRRKKRRRKNQGSKSDIKVDINEANQGANAETTEHIFNMDEDLSGVTRAFEESGISQSRSFHRDFFSDTEVDPTNTPPNSRPGTPIQSDSEYEISKMHKQNEDDEVGKWVWGELPSTSGNTTPAVTPLGFPGQQVPAGRKTPASGLDETTVSSDDEGNRNGNKSMLAGMFSFMNRTKTSASAPGDTPTSGVYLDDLNIENMDPEVAALYFPNFHREESSKHDREEDVESGNGSSLPQSPAPGSSPKSSHLAAHMEERRRNESSSSTEGQSKFEAISFCGNSLGLFEQSQLSYDELVENPDILLNSPPESIVVKIDGKLVPWNAALPQLLSTTFFKRPLPSSVYQKLMEQQSRKDEGSSSTLDNTSGDMAVGSDKEGSARGRGYSWFPWRRSQTSQDQGGADQSAESANLLSKKESPKAKSMSPAKNIGGSGQVQSVTSSSDESEGGGGQDTKSPRKARNVTAPISIQEVINGPEKFKKTLRLNSEQINALALHYGQNEAVFSVTTAYQGTTVARCHIYLWRYDDRIVISDIDGTITKSDVLGHILPIIGNDWAQSGVAQLFTQINANGYKMLYLSARAIGQAQTTREYLRSVRQGSSILPDGPLLLNPTSLMSAFHREVIEKKPEEFKIHCLKDIQTLFPRSPFYAGYGNRINDVWSYRAVDINISRIFTINHKGELRHALTNTFQSSYTSLVELVEHIFPPYKSTSSCDMDGFSTFEFWRDQLPPIAGQGGQGDNYVSEEEPMGRPRSYTVA